YGDAVRTLLDRDPAAKVSLDDSSGVAWLLEELRAAGGGDAARTLAGRAAGPAAPAAPRGRPPPVQGPRAARPRRAGRTPDGRAAAQAALDDAESVAWLLEELREAGHGDAVRTLLDRAANAGRFDFFLNAHPDEASTYRFGREPDGTPSQSWRWESG